LAPSDGWARVLEVALGASGAPVYVVNDDGRVLGAILLEDVAALIREESVLERLLVAADVMRSVEPASMESTLARCLRSLSREGVDERPVTDEEGRLIGVITRSDLLALYDREVLSRGSSLVTFSDRDEEGTPLYTTVHIPDDARLETIVVAGELVGRTLRSLDLRAKHGIHVHALRTEGSDAQMIPDANRPLEEGQVLLVTGNRDAIDRVRSQAHHEV
ncbi:MAG: CBS domain-containing protein, partial [Myxococcales bacterium]|nr:CBS domain-containing protein [Myxococcales bacterium]